MVCLRHRNLQRKHEGPNTKGDEQLLVETSYYSFFLAVSANVSVSQIITRHLMVPHTAVNFIQYCIVSCRY